MDESGEQFVAYFLPTEETLGKRKRDEEDSADYVPEEEYVLFELEHNKINKVTHAAGGDSDQPWHPPSMINVFAVRLKKVLDLSYS